MISFSAISQAQYDALSGAYVQDRIYYITDIGKQYLNGVEYGGEDLSNYATTGYVEAEVSGKQDIIDENNPLDAHSVSTELNPWPYGDPEFRVDDAINEVLRIANEANDALTRKARCNHS